MSQTSDSHVRATPIWPLGVSLVLAILILMMLARPCELYRIKVSLTEPGFSWTTTLAAEWPDRGCYCQSTDPNDPMLIAPGVAARPKSKDRGVIVPEVSF